MRFLLSAALLAALTVSANAAEIRVLAPGFVIKLFMVIFIKIPGSGSTHDWK